MSDFSVFDLPWLSLPTLVMDDQILQHVCEHSLQALFVSIAPRPSQSLLVCYRLYSQAMLLLPWLLLALWDNGTNPSRLFRHPFPAPCQYTCIRCRPQPQQVGNRKTGLDFHSMTRVS